MTFQRKITLGQAIFKYKMHDDMVDEINKIYNKESKNMIAHNDYLAGKIVEQKRIDDYLNDDIKEFFLKCFTEYLNEYSQMSYGIREVKLFNAWVNEMKENEYNPLHIHRGTSQLGLSSVLCLKSLSDYGKEYSTDKRPVNGALEFIANGGGTFYNNQYRTYLNPGDLFIFPYDMWHGVYPFNSTKEIRRTLSYNCDMIV